VADDEVMGAAPDEAARSASGLVAGREPDEEGRRLWLQARAAATNAYAPYSGLRVGAALSTAGGATFSGVNVENAAYPAGLCAERAALAGAVAAGALGAGQRLTAVAVARVDDGPIGPCGLCLQALAEFGDPDIIVAVSAGADAAGAPAVLRVVALHELLRAPFRLGAHTAHDTHVVDERHDAHDTTDTPDTADAHVPAPDEGERP